MSKTHLRIEAVGHIDELSSLLGVVRALGCDEEIASTIEMIQRDLFWVGADLAGAPPAAPCGRIVGETVRSIEEAIDRAESGLEPLDGFVLPGGSPVAAHLHHARAVCRRAERAVVATAATEPLDPAVLGYLNRLGDLLFCLARAANRRAGTPDRTVR